MSNIYVEKQKDGTYRATQNKQVIAVAQTQAQTAKTAHAFRPNDPILAERVRDTSVGSRDKWRRFYP